MIKVNFWLLTGIMLVNLVLIMESLCPNSEQATFDADLASEASRGAFPLLSHHFKENKGQITNPAARFYFSQADYGIAFTETGLIFKLSSHMQRNVCVNRALDPLFERTKGLELEKPSSSIKSGIGITLHFEGARRVRPIGQQMYQHLSNYFLGADPNHWVTGVRSFNQIVYPELYEGIDLIYYFTVDGLRYDFVVKPGGDPQAIKLRYEGIDQLSIDKTGALIAQTPLRSLIDQDLFIYQDTPKGRHEIRGAFTLYDDTTFGFHLFDSFFSEFPLVFDPLIWSTILGDEYSDRGYSIALDASNNVYVTGYTNSANFPTTSGAYNETHTKHYDAFVCKLSADGSSLGYSTFLGGNDNDVGKGIALDASNNAYITGHTFSRNFPTTSGAYDETYNNYSDVFVCKLSADGSSLGYSTFLGGSLHDYGMGIALDASNNAYITGYTNSTDFPTTLNAYNATGDGDYQLWDVFVFKLAANGITLLYSTYVSGSDDDYSQDITLDASNNVYVTGYTNSANFPTTSGAY
ncbi:MAG: SBBP repeat-containing protein, partial [Promethearchaeota archaeon]